MIAQSPEKFQLESKITIIHSIVSEQLSLVRLDSFLSNTKISMESTIINVIKS